MDCAHVDSGNAITIYWFGSESLDLRLPFVIGHVYVRSNSSSHSLPVRATLSCSISSSILAMVNSSRVVKDDSMVW